MPKIYPKVCVRCGASYETSSQTGKFCKSRCRVKSWQQKCRSAGLCGCGRKRDGGFQRCAKCRESHRQRNLRRPSRAGLHYSPEELAQGRERKRAWYLKNKQKVIDDGKRWYQEHPDQAFAKHARRRRRQYEAEGSHTRQEWNEILRQHDYKCVHCGTTEQLTKDHIVPLAKSGSDYAANLQPLCLPCNSRKKDKVAA
jgi:5-methylcytosine-specific restriction endonuclease McrA